MEAFLENDRKYRSRQAVWVIGLSLVNLIFLYGMIFILAIGHGLLGAHPRSYPYNLEGWLQTADMLWVVGLPVFLLTILTLVGQHRWNDSLSSSRLILQSAMLWILTAIIGLALLFNLHEYIVIIVIAALYVPIVGYVVEWYMYNFR